MSKQALEEEWSSVLAALRATGDAEAVLGPLRVRGELGGECALKLWQLSLQAEDQRRAGGVYYTDYAEALVLAERVLARFEAFPERVLEPCCGGGSLLAALLDAGVERFGQPAETLAASIHAYELNASGLWLAQWTISERFGAGVAAQIQWTETDTLEALAPSSAVGDRYALIFGNPPYGNAIERSTRRSKDDRALYASRYPLATCGAFDKCALFVEMAAQRCAPGGQISYILPRSWLAQPASQHLRAKLAEDFQLLEIADLPSAAFFDASVATVALTLARRKAVSQTAASKTAANQTVAPNTEPTLVLAPGVPPVELDAAPLLLEGNWGAALHPFAKSLVHALETLPLLSSRVDFSAGASTEEAYAWINALRDIGPPPEASDVSNASASSHATTLPPNRSALLYTLDQRLVASADAASSDAASSDATSSDGSSSDATSSAQAERVTQDALKARPNADEKPLVIAGLLDPFELHWGKTPTRYLRQDYARPMITLSELRETRRARSATPRALLPTLSLSLEAWPDLDGAVVGAVSTISAWVRSDDEATVRAEGADDGAKAADFAVSSKAESMRDGLLSSAPAASMRHAQRQTLILCALLNSAWIRTQYACLFGALALNGGNTQVSKNKLAALRVPQAWLTLLDAGLSPDTAPPELTQHLRSAPPLPLSKRLPTLETLAELQLRGRAISGAFSPDAIGATLIALVETDAHAALHAGYLDQLLLALAPELPIALEHSPCATTKAALD